MKYLKNIFGGKTVLCDSGTHLNYDFNIYSKSWFTPKAS